MIGIRSCTVVPAGAADEGEEEREAEEPDADAISVASPTPNIGPIPPMPCPKLIVVSIDTSPFCFRFVRTSAAAVVAVVVPAESDEPDELVAMMLFLPMRPCLVVPRAAKEAFFLLAEEDRAATDAEAAEEDAEAR